MRKKKDYEINKCPNCGLEFPQTHRGERRIYCSHSCWREYIRRDEVEIIRKLAEEKKTSSDDIRVKDFAISLYHEGYGRTAIAEAFGIHVATLKRWLYKHKNPDKKYVYKAPKLEIPREPIDYAYKYTRTAEEWVTALRDKTRGYPRSVSQIIDNRPVYLMCGRINVRKNAASLCEIVKLRLGLDPFDGGVFAFSNRGHTYVVCIFVDGRGLCFLQYHRNNGTYPWPSPELGNSILISGEDFERLLCCGNRYRTTLSWNDLDFSNSKKPRKH